MQPAFYWLTRECRAQMYFMLVPSFELETLYCRCFDNAMSKLVIPASNSSGCHTMIVYLLTVQAKPQVLYYSGTSRNFQNFDGLTQHPFQNNTAMMRGVSTDHVQNFRYSVAWFEVPQIYKLVSAYHNIPFSAAQSLLYLFGTVMQHFASWLCERSAFSTQIWHRLLWKNLYLLEFSKIWIT